MRYDGRILDDLAVCPSSVLQFAVSLKCDNEMQISFFLYEKRTSLCRLSLVKTIHGPEQ